MNPLEWMYVFPILFTPLLVGGLFMLHKAGRDRDNQNKIIERFRVEIGDHGWKRIYISRPGFFSKWLKFFPYQGRGILINYPEYIKVVSFLRDGEFLEKDYRKDLLNLEWLGSQGFASSNLHWIKIGQDHDSLIISADTGFVAVQSREETADICRMIDSDFTLPKVALTEFALEKNKASLLVVILFFILIGFSFIDGIILNKYRLIYTVTIAPWLISLLLTLLLIMLSALCYLFLKRNKVPWRESYMLSFLLTIALALSCIPITKRLDQFLPGASSDSYEYEALGNAKFESVISGPPILKFNETKEYWEQFEKGSIHNFELIHGALGLWQLNEADLKGQYKQFYDEYNKNN